MFKKPTDGLNDLFVAGGPLVRNNEVVSEAKLMFRGGMPAADMIRSDFETSDQVRKQGRGRFAVACSYGGTSEKALYIQLDVSILRRTLEPISKKRFLVQIKAKPSINPQEY